LVSNSGRSNLNASRVSPSRRAATIGGTSRWSTWKRIDGITALALLQNSDRPSCPHAHAARLQRTETNHGDSQNSDGGSASTPDARLCPLRRPPPQGPTSQELRHDTACRQRCSVSNSHRYQNDSSFCISSATSIKKYSGMSIGMQAKSRISVLFLSAIGGLNNCQAPQIPQRIVRLQCNLVLVNVCRVPHAGYSIT
jgi:hypothetical protein